MSNDMKINIFENLINEEGSYIPVSTNVPLVDQIDDFMGAVKKRETVYIEPKLEQGKRILFDVYGDNTVPLYTSNIPEMSNINKMDINVKCIVISDNHILMVKKKGLWTIPEGSISNKDNTFNDAIGRVIKENTKHNINGKLAYVYNSITSTNNECDFMHICMYHGERKNYTYDNEIRWLNLKDFRVEYIKNNNINIPGIRYVFDVIIKFIKQYISSDNEYWDMYYAFSSRFQIDEILLYFCYFDLEQKSKYTDKMQDIVLRSVEEAKMINI